MTDIGTHLKRSEEESTETPKEVRDSVYDILERVRAEGDGAIHDLTRKFDEVDLDQFQVPQADVDAAADQLSADERETIDYAVERVRDFAEAQFETIDDDFEREFGDGISCGQRTLPLEAAGTYVPGGNYTHIASIPMSVVPAKVAGVERVVTCTPPQADGSADPYQLYAMDQAGVDEIYTIGGAQAIGAMAYGTESIDPVDVVAGPGNVFVVEAKRQVFGQVDLDLLPGPTDVLVLADETADPEIVAIDLLSQAEHTATSRPKLVSTDEALAEAVLDEIEAVLPTLETQELARECWERMGEVVVVDDYDAATTLANEMAMEHLQVMTENPRELVSDLRNYGSLFLGENAPVTFGDKVTGPNHILPTHGTARFTGGCWVGTYLKTVTHQELTPGGAAHLSPYAAAISELEGMDGHRLSAARRPIDDD
jgi:histidinol dehydrogenase/sulfopropanediol 3-dehydrogenase